MASALRNLRKGRLERAAARGIAEDVEGDDEALWTDPQGVTFTVLTFRSDPPSVFGMAHIHDRIDFTVAIFVVHADQVLLVHHRQLDKWLPLGGHIELDEDPETAALREAREESGLEVELIGERPPTTGPGTRALIAPRFLDIHRISGTHEHIGLIYWARPRTGTLALAAAEHHDIRWCSAADLDTLQPPMDHAVKWYCLRALTELGDREPAPHVPRPPAVPA